MASSEQIAKEYYEKGMHLIRVNSIELGIDNLNMAKSIYEELDDSTNYIMTLRGLAIAYGIMGYDSKMLYKCLNAFDYLDKNRIRGAKHFFYATICNRYMLLGDYDSAINYGKMAMQDLEEYGKVESMPVLEGKRMIMFIAPKKTAPKKATSVTDDDDDELDDDINDIEEPIRKKPQQKAQKEYTGPKVEGETWDD